MIHSSRTKNLCNLSWIGSFQVSSDLSGQIWEDIQIILGCMVQNPDPCHWMHPDSCGPIHFCLMQPQSRKVVELNPFQCINFGPHIKHNVWGDQFFLLHSPEFNKVFQLMVLLHLWNSISVELWAFGHCNSTQSRTWSLLLNPNLMETNHLCNWPALPHIGR